MQSVIFSPEKHIWGWDIHTSHSAHEVASSISVKISEAVSLFANLDAASLVISETVNACARAGAAAKSPTKPENLMLK